MRSNARLGFPPERQEDAAFVWCQPDGSFRTLQGAQAAADAKDGIGQARFKVRLQVQAGAITFRRIVRSAVLLRLFIMAWRSGGLGLIFGVHRYRCAPGRRLGFHLNPEARGKGEARYFSDRL